MPDLVGEDALVADVGLHRTHLADDEAGGTRGGDGGVGQKLRAGHRTEQPDGAERRDRA